MEKIRSYPINKLAASDRGETHLGWLQSKHSFSFGEYHNPQRMGFRDLRVINDDIIAAGKGFGTHPHRNMEIFSYVIDGELEHKDSLGNGRIIKAGEFQYMSAGNGILHSEFNPSKDKPGHFLQIWIRPLQTGGEPSYEELTLGEVSNELKLLASLEGENDSISIRQDARIYFGRFNAGSIFNPETHRPKSYYWIQMVKGSLRVEDLTLEQGDGAAIEGSSPTIRSIDNSEFLLFDLK